MQLHCVSCIVHSKEVYGPALIVVQRRHSLGWSFPEKMKTIKICISEPFYLFFYYENDETQLNIMANNFNTSVKLKMYYNYCMVSLQECEQITCPSKRNRNTSISSFPVQKYENISVQGLCTILSRIKYMNMLINTCISVWGLCTILSRIKCRNIFIITCFSVWGLCTILSQNQVHEYVD